MNVGTRLAKATRYFLLWAGWRKPGLIDIENVKRFTPPPEYRAYWDWLVDRFRDRGLSVHTSDFDRVEWYTAPFLPKRLATFMAGYDYLPESARVWGFACLWDKPVRIVLLEDKLQQHPCLASTLVRHEMTHVIANLATHDDPHYDPRFLNVL